MKKHLKCHHGINVLFLIFFAINLLSCRHNNTPGLVIRELDKGWEFKKASDTTWLPATVPGTVHTDLLNNKIIEEPFYRDAESRLQWVEKETWNYRSAFDVENEILQKENIFLNFEGLDSYAEVSLNGQTILTCDNMFRTWQADVKPLLKENGNVLEVTFFPSPVQDSLRAKSLPYQLPDSRVFTRKAAYQSGWDWGPKFVTCGIWRPATIHAWNNFRIQNIFISNDSLTEDKAFMNLEVNILSAIENEATIELIVDKMPLKSQKVDIVKGFNKMVIPFGIENPELWWSNGLGEPHLYQAEVRLVSSGFIFDVKNTKFGIRKIELVQEPDSIGSSFYFKLNGRPVFMKGANYIPSESFTTRTTADKYRALILSVREANMNMLRVWGGGIYENDIFYDLCDENGILVWQDFMFACNLYPGGEDFFKSVLHEAEDNILRLRNHPSLALWCGNNEVDEAWHNWGWQKQFGYSITDSSEIWNNYLKIFHQIIPETVQKLDPDRLYHPSSPTFGWGRKESMLIGDSHFWGVWWGEQPFEIYKAKVGRFMSEYGFQGMPTINSIKKFTLPADQKLSSEVMQAHQKHPRGAQIINLYMEQDYKIPDDFAGYVYVSQLLQAEGMTTAIEAHRRAMPRCMGTLYWQLNDCWPVTSWSSVDYYGNWKALHYFVRDAFAKNLVSPVVENDSLKVYIISDEITDFDAKLKMNLIDFEGKNLWQQDVPVTIKGNCSEVYFVRSVENLLKNSNKQKIVLLVELEEGDQILSKKMLYFVKPKNLKLPDVTPEITVEAIQQGYWFQISSKALIKNLHLELPDVEGHFDRNFVDVLPGEKVELVFTTQSTITANGLRSDVYMLNKNQKYSVDIKLHQ